MPYVYSTASCSTDFCVFVDIRDKTISRVQHRITIKGGANVIGKAPHLVTNKGIVTKVSDEDLELLEKDFHFKEAVRLGYYYVDKVKANANKVAKDMEPKDGGAQKSISDPEFKDVKEAKKGNK